MENSEIYLKMEFLVINPENKEETWVATTGFSKLAKDYIEEEERAVRDFTDKVIMEKPIALLYIQLNMVQVSVERVSKEQWEAEILLQESKRAKAGEASNGTTEERNTLH